jgi:hypothetical protein
MEWMVLTKSLVSLIMAVRVVWSGQMCDRMVPLVPEMLRPKLRRKVVVVVVLYNFC